MRNFWNKVLYNKKIIITVLFFIVFSFILNAKFSLAQSAQQSMGLSDVGSWIAGGIGAAVAGLLGIIAYIITAVIGLLITLTIAVLIQVAQFNGIINVPTVVQGWVIVRDLVNMFFILILLVIAFATILRIESYSAKRLLPKLLIMAVLINFSKTIFGLLIDFSQVIMLTFVAAFKEGGGWFIEMFRTNILLSIKSNNAQTFAVTTWSTALAIIAGVLGAIITLITTVVLLVVLVFRVVMLWIYTILSPLVFLGFGFPPIQKYTGRVWEDFVKQLVVGPMLAFFIWLALTSLTPSVDMLNKQSMQVGTEVCGGIGAFFCQADFQKFIIAIALLMGGLMVTQSIGGLAGAAAGKGMQWAKRAGMAPLKGAKDLTLTAGRKLDTAQMKLQQRIFGGEGKDYFAKSLNPWQMKKGWDASRAEAKLKYELGEETRTPPSATWHDIFNKYAGLNQYLAIKKSPKDIVKDRTLATRFNFDATRSEARIKNTALDESDRQLMRDKYTQDKDKMIANYMQYAPPKLKTDAEKRKYADEQYGYDWMSLDRPDQLNKAEDERIIKENRAQAVILSDVRKSFFGKKIGFEKAAEASGVRYKYSKLGAEEQYDKALSEIRRQSGDDSGAITEEILNALARGETSRVVGGLRLLTQNNDMNEFLKDQRVIDLMTKNNGLLDKLVKSRAIKELDSSNKEAIEDLKREFRSSPVTAANAQAMMQAMFKELGLNDSMAAKIANGIGEIGIQKGNTLTYAMAKADPVKGGHTFEDIFFKDGRLHTSEGRRAAGVGKLNTFEAQAWARNMHPNDWFAEDANSMAAYITDEGEAILRGLTAHHLEQIKRLRSDHFKAARNPKILKQLRDLADKIEQEGNKKQADLIRYFGGYIKTKFQGQGLSQEKEFKEALYKD